MEPNAIEIRRIYTRREGDLVPDQTLRESDNNQIVVEWEAGATANAALTTAGDVKLEIFTRDLVDNTDVAALCLTRDAGTEIDLNTDGDSRNGTYEYAHTVTSATDFDTDHTYEITASLLRPNSTVSFAVCNCSVSA
jgi:hypothetical protein